MDTMFEEISEEHCKDFALAIGELGVEQTDVVPSYGTALERLSVGVINAERSTVEFKSKAWKAVFSTWSAQLWNAGRPMMLEAARSAAFDANAMRKEWQPIWAPDGKQGEGVQPEDSPMGAGKDTRRERRSRKALSRSTQCRRRRIS